MNYLSILTEDDVRYICSVIPLEDSVCYFKQYPKDFAKVMPGFRATSMKRQEQISALIFRYRKQSFIASFIDKHICRWLEEIQGHIAKRMDDGDNHESALLQTLPNCFFSDNVGLFFKLINEEHSDEYIALLCAAVKTIKKFDDKREKLDKEIKDKDFEIKKLHVQFEFAQADSARLGAKLNETSAEIKDLKITNVDVARLKDIIQSNEETNEALISKVQDQEKIIKQLSKELLEMKDGKKQIEDKIQTELEKQLTFSKTSKEVAKKAKCPNNIDEFKDYLGYNLENLGVATSSEYFALLKEHLCCILFQGIPVVINQGVGKNLMKCIGNALISVPIVKTLTFGSDLSTQDVGDFLSTDERIVCLDNFVGNFNETELLPLFERHRDKVVFLTVAYDRTLNFVSGEFLRYCHYLNFNRIEALVANAELTEDPSTVEEVEARSQIVSPDTRYSKLLREMLCEFAFRRSLVEHKCINVSTEQDLCRALAFDILPYCVDVLQIAPFNTSERLIKYAGNAGRCPYKNLFKVWFE